MDRLQLEKKLDELGIKKSDYSLDGTLLSMRTILFFANPGWLTFEYDERGNALNRKEFVSEDEACQDMLNRLISLYEFRKKYNLK